MPNRTSTRFSMLCVWLSFIVFFVLILHPLNSANAQGDDLPRVQVTQGSLQVSELHTYLLRDLEANQQLSVYVTTLSGNLDPTLNLVLGDTDVDAALEEMLSAVEAQAEQGGDPIQALLEYESDVVLIRDDDSGEGYDATFDFTIPEAGDYMVVVASTSRNLTFGGYEVTFGINAPDVGSGDASATGDEIATLIEDPSVEAAVQEITGNYTGAFPRRIRLTDLTAGDTLSVFAEAVDSDLIPQITLVDFSGKGLRSDNVGGQDRSATLEFTPPEDAVGFEVILEGADETTGEYRVLVGINAQDVVAGNVTANAEFIVVEPTPVSVGVHVQQITSIDQRAENFAIAGQVRFEWMDPERAFRPDRCQCQQLVFAGAAFNQFLSDETTLWPDYLFLNQQGRRDTQNRVAVIEPNGFTEVGEQFTVTLQAPDFHFRAYPFDRQTFYVRVQSIFSENLFVFQENVDFTGFGDQLGEEEWRIVESEVLIETVNGASQFALRFDARRNLNFYLFRIFLPIALILVVSWFTFFLEDYGKRIDVTSANLLIFVAFNFTVSGDLPRLGYLTFLDTILIGTFAITSLIVAANVYLKRLQRIGQDERAKRIDRALITLYPLSYIIIYGILAVQFLVL